MKFDISLLISCFICGIVEIYTVSKILNKNFFSKKKWVLLGIFILTVYQFFAYQLTDNFLRTIILLFIIILLSKIIYNENLSRIVISAFLSWLILLISEVIFMLLLATIFKLEAVEIQSNMKDSSMWIFFINLGIYVIDFTIISIKKIRSYLIKVCEKFDKISNRYLMLFILIVAMTFSIQLYLFYVPMSQIVKVVLNIVILLLYSVVLIFLFNEKNENIKMQQNLSFASQNLHEYENMLDYQRVANHENKNQLLVIKGKIAKGDNDIIEYIDSIIKENREDNENFYEKTKMIPSGGLQGLIYYKSLVIKDNNINLILDIDRKVRKYNFKNLTLDETSSICKIAGVWIDNAIQSAMKCPTPEINIQMKLDNNNNLVFNVSNSFTGEIDLEKLSTIGYTTKGKGHGYGLSLVSNIIHKNMFLENKRIINGGMFTQCLIIKK